MAADINDFLTNGLAKGNVSYKEPVSVVTHGTKSQVFHTAAFVATSCL